MAESVFVRQPKPRMRQQRNNSVASAPDMPADGATDEAQLSIVPDAGEPTFDDVVDIAGPEADPEQDAAPQDAPTPNDEPSDSPPRSAESASNSDAAEASATKAAAAAQDPAEANGDENDTADATTSPETAEPTPDDGPDATADTEPPQQAPQPAPSSTPAKKNGKAPAAKARTANRAPAPAAPTSSGTALAVINPDGSVTVDAGTHLVDLRDVAAQDDPHALVDMLGALRPVADSELRQHVTTEISAAITAAALRN